MKLLPKGAYSIETRNPADYRFWRFPASALEAAARAVRNRYQMRALSAQKRTQKRQHLIDSVYDKRKSDGTPRFFRRLGDFSSPRAEFMPSSIPDFAIAFSQNGQAADEKGILKRRFVWLLVVVWARIEKEAKCLKSR